MTETSTTPSTTTSKAGSHIQLIPPMLPLPVIPPLVIVPVNIPPPKSSNSKAATINAMTRAVLVVAFVVSFLRECELEADRLSTLDADVVAVCSLRHKGISWPVIAPSSQPDANEPQRVGDHGPRAQRHCKSLSFAAEFSADAQPRCSRRGMEGGPRP